MVIPSNTELDMTGCTVAFANTSVQTNMLQNKAVTPVAVATDAATTAGSGVVTSAALAAVAVVGQQLAVVGAGPAGGDGGGAIWLYGTVLSIVGNNITLTSSNVNGIAATSTLVSATAYLFNRDSNITVVGGNWNGGTNWNASSALRNAAGFNTHQMRFRRIDGLTVTGATLTLVSFPQAGGWCYGINPGDCTNFRVKDCTTNGSDGVHVDGPAARGFITNISGTTHDDHVALGAVNFQGNDLEGDITNVLVDCVNANGSLRAVKLFGGAGANGAQRIVSGVTVRGVKGSTVLESVALSEYAGSSTIDAVIEDVCAVPGAGNPLVLLSATLAQTVTIRDIRWPTRAGIPNGGVVKSSANSGALIVEDMEIEGISGTGAFGLNLAATTGTYNLVRLDGVTQLGAMTVQLVQITATATIDRLSVQNFRKKGPGYVVQNQNNATPTKEIEIAHGKMDGFANLYFGGSSTNAATLKVSNLDATQTNNGIITTQHPLTLLVENCTLALSFGLAFAQAANATPVRILTSNVSMTGASKALVTRDGTQVLSVSGLTGQVDQTILTPQDGDIFYNSNATPLNGVGLAIFNSVAAKIKNIYTGTTN